MQQQRNVLHKVYGLVMILALVISTISPFTISAAELDEQATLDVSEEMISANQLLLPGPLAESTYMNDLVLKVDGEVLPYTYNEDEKVFEVQVPIRTTAVEIYPTFISEGTTLNISGSKAIANGYNLPLTTTEVSFYSETTKNANIHVRTSSTGTKNLESYTFKFTRPAVPMTVENSSDLLDLAISFHTPVNKSVANKVYVEKDGALVETIISEQVLQENSTFYINATTATLAETIDKVTVTPTARYSSMGATYTYIVNGKLVSENNTNKLDKYLHSNFEYEPGKFGTKIELMVQPSPNAPEGSTEKHYTIIVPKTISSSTNVTALSIASANNHQFLEALGEGKLTQKGTTTAKFNSSVYEYETIVNYNINYLAMKTTFDGPGTTLKYNVNGEEIIVKESATNVAIPIKVGNNTITVRAIPENSDETNIKTYTFNVKRKANYNIATITSEEMRISGKLRPTLTTLAGIIEAGTTVYSLTLNAEDATKQITIEQNGEIVAQDSGSVSTTLDASIIEVSGTKNISKNPVTITISDETDRIVYTLDTWERNPNAPNRVYAILPAPGQFVNEHAQTVTGSLGSFGWGDGWDTSLYATSANLSAAASGTPGVSLGGFGGFITYQFDNPVKNDPSHPYGADFIVNGNGFSGNEEPGGVMVAQDLDKDGKPDKDAKGQEIWYELAGSEHYEDKTIWDYSITYTNTVENFFPNFGENVPWQDSLNRSGEIIHNSYHAQLYYPITDNYQFNGNAANELMSDKQISFTGTNIQTLKSLYGYADVSPNNQGKTVATNPYEHKDAGGGFFDIDWAVDKNGQPVRLEEISFVKVYTNQQTDGGSVGEKSPEILGVLRINDEAKATGKTEAPIIKINDQQITLTEDSAFIPVAVESLEGPLKVAVESNAANVYINNVKAATRDYEKVPEKGIIRVLVQNGDQTPAIYTLKIIEQVNEVTSIELNKTVVTLQEGKTATVTATIISNNPAVTYPVTWTSANEEVATVQNGTITAVNAGTTTITVKAGEKSVSIEVTIEQAKSQGENSGNSSGNESNSSSNNGSTTETTPKPTPSGYVYVSFEDFGERPAGEMVDYPTPFGTLIDREAVPFYAGDTIADVTLRLLDSQKIDAKYQGTTKNGFYLASLLDVPTSQGIISEFGEFNAGPLSGWMISWNNWFINEGASQFEVEDGDIIKWQYTSNLGIDLKVDWNVKSAQISSLNIQSVGTLAPAFSRDVKNYTLTVPKGTSSVQLEAAPDNYWSKVDYKVGSQSYKLLRPIPVEHETIITITSEFREYYMDVTPQDTDKITITIVEEGNEASTSKDSVNGGGTGNTGTIIPEIPIQSEIPEQPTEEVNEKPEQTVKPETPEQQAPNESNETTSTLEMVTVDGKQSAQLKVGDAPNMTVTSEEGIAIQIDDEAVEQEILNISLQVANDTIALNFEANDAAVKLKKYAQITIPATVLSPANGAVLLQRLLDGSLIAVPHTVVDGQFILKVKTSGDYVLLNTDKTFKDIAKDGHKDYIKLLAKRHIVNGKSDELYDPKAGMTRGQFSAMLVRALQLEAKHNPQFTDTTKHQFANEMQALVEMGVLKGSGDKLMPNGTLTRNQSTLMIHRLLTYLQVELPKVNVENLTFTDKNKLSTSSLESVALMQQLGIFTGKADGSFDPNGRLTRSQMAKVICKALNYAKMM